MADYMFTNVWGAYLERSFLKKSYKWPAEKIEQYQVGQVNHIISSAKRLKGFAYLNNVKKINSLYELSSLPLLEKQKIKASPEDFLHQSKWLLEDHTSGSTGNPLTIFLTPKQKALEFAYVLRYYKRFGYQFGDRMAAFRSYVPASNDEPKWNYLKKRNELLFSVYHMTPDNLRHYLIEFNRFQPKFVRGYPTSIYIVALFAIQNNITIKAPQAIFCSSEVLSEDQKIIIEKAFGASAINWYGSNERAITASQCQYLNGLHVHEEAGVLEVINESGESSLQNQQIREGEIVVTGIVNDAMPLIRYRLGDIGAITNQPCECGFKGTSLTQVIGRTDDIIVTAAGKSVPPVRFYTLFEKHPSVKMFQVVQQPDRVTININLVTSGAIDDFKLKSDLSYFLGERNQLVINFLSEIAPEKSGKRKHIKVIKPNE
jgi:phenylacetate-CoA ligase